MDNLARMVVPDLPDPRVEQVRQEHLAQVDAPVRQVNQVAPGSKVTQVLAVMTVEQVPLAQQVLQGLGDPREALDKLVDLEMTVRQVLQANLAVMVEQVRLEQQEEMAAQVPVVKQVLQVLWVPLVLQAKQVLQE